MGGMVSTSNHIMGDTVEVETDAIVLFTIEIGGGDAEGQQKSEGSKDE
jgi:hypothetical protein